jgi:Zn-dependent peptidase ImmA (M78 family)/transcriptional regulator with XRE-family HTH domain
MFNQRLKQLRLSRGLSLDNLSVKMGRLVTKQSLSKYEIGKTYPSPTVLNKLASALGVKSAYLLSEPKINVEFIAYRKGSGLGIKEQREIEACVSCSLEERIRLQELTGKLLKSDLPVKEFRIDSIEKVENTANEMRELWKLGQDPIASLTGVLEDHFVHVLEIDTEKKFDGISALARSDDGNVIAAAVVSRTGIAGERQRLNLAHELGHIVLNVSEDIDEEKVAFRFGAAFLFPNDVVYREFGTKRAFVQQDELLLFKRRFGISLQSIIYRLHDLRIINDSHYKEWWRNINKLEWKKQEPCELPYEKSQWLKQKVLYAFSEGFLTKEEAQKMLGKNLKTKEPVSLIERKEFMKLPLEKRRQILKEQADNMALYYEDNTEWKESQGGDIVEY